MCYINYIMHERQPVIEVVEFTHHDFAISSLVEALEVLADLEEIANDVPHQVPVYRTWMPPSHEVLDAA